MLREPAASPDYLPAVLSFSDDSPQNDSEESLWLRGLIQDYLTIASEGSVEIDSLSAEDRGLLAQHNSRIIVSFTGSLRQDAETTYQKLDAALLSRNNFALLRENHSNPTAPAIILILKGRPATPKAWSIWPNIALFLITIVSLLYTGTATAIGELSSSDPVGSDTMARNLYSFAILPELWRGWPYALSILLILCAHEMGHYLMMRYHKAHATLPYFLPSVVPFGTLGAAIVLREPLKNRKMLLDVGASGPIAGFLVALPILFIGLATSHLYPLESGWVEGNSLLYYFAKFVVFHEMIPSATHDVLVNQVAWAGWTGLFFTALNLLPLGQLDGGHVMYALFGARARLAYIPVLIGLILLMFISQQTTWILFFGLLFFFGRVYAVPLNDISPLDAPRRVIGVVALLIFVLCFTPFIVTRNEVAIDPAQSSMLFGMIGTAFLLMRRR